MPREHFTKAPVQLRSKIHGWLATVHEGLESPYHVIQRIFAAGWDLAREDIGTPRHDLAERSPSTYEKNLVRLNDSTAWTNEENAVKLWESRRQWAATTSIESDQKAASEKRATDEKRRQDFVAQRQKQILASEQQTAKDRALAQAQLEANGRFR